MKNPFRLLTVRAVPYTLVGLTLIKLALFLSLEAAGVMRPFIGDNARDVSLPIAERLIHEGRFNGPESRPDSHYPPGYPFLLAIAMTVSPTHYATLMVAVQMAADLLLALTLYWVGATFLSWQAGLLAGVAWLLLPPEVVLSTWITQETLFTALLTWSTVVLVLSLPRKTAGLAFAAGLLLGVATMFRPTAMYFPIFCLPLWFFRDIPRRWQKGLLFFLGCACLIAPWAIRNWVVLDDRILVSTGYGGSIFQSSDERMYTIAGKRKWYPYMHAESAKDGIVKPASDKESEIDRWLLRMGLRNYRLRWEQRPWSFIPFFVDRFFRMWYANESGGFLPQFVMGLSSLVIVPIGLWRVWRWRLTNPGLAGVVGLLVLYFVAVHIVVFPILRYLLPVYPLLVVAWAEPVAAWLFPKAASASPA